MFFPLGSIVTYFSTEKEKCILKYHYHVKLNILIVMFYTRNYCKLITALQGLHLNKALYC